MINPEKETALIIARSSIKMRLSDGINNCVDIKKIAEKNIVPNILTIKSLKFVFFNIGEVKNSTGKNKINNAIKNIIKNQNTPSPDQVIKVFSSFVV